MPVLETKKLTKAFKDFVAVDNISFFLSEGEILGILGPNGAGKTTTIQMLLGILTPTSGEIYYFGKDLRRHRPEIMERVNFSSAYTNLPGYMTVKEIIVSISYLYDIKSRKKRLEELIQKFCLEEIYTKKVSTLSAGQVTRVNLAKAFLNSPQVLLLDEPTASLDVEMAKYIRTFLLERRKEGNLSIIITSHNMAEVEKLCDRVIVINQGKIVADGTPLALAKSIKTAHVEIMVHENWNNIEEFLRKKQIFYRKNAECVSIVIPVKAVPDLLRGIFDNGISYDEMNIIQPTLEDFFVEVIKSKKYEIT